MALTRKMLEAMSIEDKVIDQIIEAHTETVESLKQQRDRYKKEAEKVEDLQKQLEAADGEDYKAKYEAEHKALETYKAQVENDKRTAKVEAKYRELLNEVGISPKRMDSVLRVTDLSDIELDKDGSIKDAEKLKASIEEEWSDFIPNTAKKGTGVETPPTNTGGSGMTKKEIMAIKDDAERQQKIAENHELFGF